MVRKVTYFCDRCGRRIPYEYSYSQISIIRRTTENNKTKHKTIKTIPLGHICNECLSTLVEDIKEFILQWK